MLELLRRRGFVMLVFRNDRPSSRTPLIQLLDPLIEHLLDVLRVRSIAITQDQQFSFHRSLELRLMIKQVLETFELCFVSRGSNVLLVPVKCMIERPELGDSENTTKVAVSCQV